MKIFCATCSILMIIRIAPDMLIDKNYGCFTIQEVRKFNTGHILISDYSFYVVLFQEVILIAQMV